MRVLLLFLLLLAAPGCSAVDSAADLGPTPSAGAPEVPEDALLQPVDLPGPDWAAGPGPAPRWLFAFDYCPAYREADYPARARQVAARDGFYGASDDRTVIHVVERFEAGWAARVFEEIRRVVTACGRYDYRTGNAGFTERLSVLATGFAGADSILVHVVQVSLGGETHARYLAAARRGELVATVAAAGLGAAEVQRLVQRAARRLGS